MNLKRLLSEEMHIHHLNRWFKKKEVVFSRMMLKRREQLIGQSSEENVMSEIGFNLPSVNRTV